MRYSSWLIALLFAGTAVTAQANKFYKWTDANGNVHYSQTKPKYQKQAKQLDIRAGKSTPVTKAAPKAAKQTQDKQSSPEKKQIDELKGQVKKQNDHMKAQRCKNLKTSLDNLLEGGRIYEMQDGKRNYLSGKQIEERRTKVKQAYQKDCS